jgi:branched-chain amino acid transport system permease protein
VSYNTGFALTIKGFTAAILGGLGSMYGAIVGGVTLGLIESLSAASITSGYQQAVPMAVLILVFLVRPGGILGTSVSRV